MYTAEFDYRRASSVQEALALLAQNPEAKLLAGGHSLVPAMKLRLASPSALIDVSRIPELRGIRLEGVEVVIGAMTTHRDLEFSGVLKTACPLLSEVVPLIGDPMVRNRGTIGGSLAHADPAADYPASMLALGATLKIVGPEGERTVSADDFFQGMFQTAVGPGELLTEIRVPARAVGQGHAYEKFAHPASRYAVVGVAAVVRMQGGAISSARIAVTGAGPGPMRLTGVEQALVGQAPTAQALETATQNAVSPDELLGDNFASAEYRAHLVSVLAKKAIARASARTS